MAEKETYTSMLVGVALFVGGMIAVVLLMKYLNTQTTARAQPVPAPLLPSSQSIPHVAVESNVPSTEFLTRSENVTDFISMVYDEQFHGLNWTSFDIVNNGPNKVYFSVNNHDSMESGIQPGQTVTVDLKQPHAIKKVYLKCDAGETANVSFYILR